MVWIGEMKDLLRSSGGGTAEDSTLSTVPVGSVVDVPAGSQQVMYGDLIVNGSYVVEGILVVDAWPT